ncbi:kinase-like protein [Aspergillus californicus]
MSPSTIERSQPLKPYPEDIRYTCVPRLTEANSSLCSGPKQTPEPQYNEVMYVTKGKFLAWGGTTILERLPSGAVIKTPIPNPYCPAEEEDHRRNMRLEAKIYIMIGEDPLEYLENGYLKEYVQRNMQNITPQLHLSPRNFLLDLDLNIKIAGFGGASLCGSDPSATPATRFRHPSYDWNAPPVFKDNIFSLGSLIYFIITGSYPYRDVPSAEVEDLYQVQQFPDVSSIICGTIITQCWHRQINSVHAIYDALTAVER